MFHYQGVPYFRSDVLTVTNTTSLYAANLGPTGLNLVFAHGSPESFGLAMDRVSATAGIAIADVLVHGAYALALWEDEALYEITGIDVSGTL